MSLPSWQSILAQTPLHAGLTCTSYPCSKCSVFSYTLPAVWLQIQPLQPFESLQDDNEIPLHCLNLAHENRTEDSVFDARSNNCSRIIYNISFLYSCTIMSQKCFQLNKALDQGCIQQVSVALYGYGERCILPSFQHFKICAELVCTIWKLDNSWSLQNSAHLADLIANSTFAHSSSHTPARTAILLSASWLEQSLAVPCAGHIHVCQQNKFQWELNVDTSHGPPVWDFHRSPHSKAPSNFYKLRKWQIRLRLLQAPFLCASDMVWSTFVDIKRSC